MGEKTDRLKKTNMCVFKLLIKNEAEKSCQRIYTETLILSSYFSRNVSILEKVTNRFKNKKSKLNNKFVLFNH